MILIRIQYPKFGGGAAGIWNDKRFDYWFRAGAVCVWVARRVGSGTGRGAGSLETKERLHARAITGDCNLKAERSTKQSVLCLNDFG